MYRTGQEHEMCPVYREFRCKIAQFSRRAEFRRQEIVRSIVSSGLSKYGISRHICTVNKKWLPEYEYLNTDACKVLLDDIIDWGRYCLVNCQTDTSTVNKKKLPEYDYMITWTRMAVKCSLITWWTGGATIWWTAAATNVVMDGSPFAWYEKWLSPRALVSSCRLKETGPARQAVILFSVLPLQPKHRLGHPENHLFLLSKKLFIGSKYPKNKLFNFEKNFTACFPDQITHFWNILILLKLICIIIVIIIVINNFPGDLTDV